MDIVLFFEKLTGYKPYDYQKRVWEKINNIIENGGKVIIEVPTAGGKTESTIIPYLHQFVTNDWKVPRLIYVLPTRSLVEKQAERIRAYVKKVLIIMDYSENEAEEISSKFVQIEYGLQETHAFLGYIVLTTWDAFLYGLSAHRTVGNRFTFPAGAIAQSLVVFDEVQMYQDESLYMPRLIGLIVQRLESANTPLVFMTATLPTKLREILNIYDRELITVLPDDTKKPERGEVTIEVIKDLSDEELINEIKKTIDKGKKALIIKNTVSSAVGVYQKLKHLGNVLLLHSRFTVKDRTKKEKDIEKANVIVATQVVEAGLDLPNVGLVITDLAPLDALIQRVGRCARRKGEKGKAIIILPKLKNIKDGKIKIVSGFNEIVKNIKSSIKLVEVISLKIKDKNKDKNKNIKVVILHAEYTESSKSKNGKSEVKYEVIPVGMEEILSRNVQKQLKEMYKSKYRGQFYVIPYQINPYDPLIILKSYDEAKNVAEYLYDINKAREALDRVYAKYYENNIVPKEFYSAYIYFRELKLFSAPPEYELKARPELFAMLYPLRDVKDDEKIDFSPENTIRVNFSWLYSNWDKFNIKFELVKEFNEQEKRWIYKSKNLENSKKPNPYSIYIIDEKCYSEDIGIVINDMEKKERPEKDKAKDKSRQSSSKKSSKTSQQTLELFEGELT